MACLERRVMNAVLFAIVIMQLHLLEVTGTCPKDFIKKEKYCYSLKKEPERFPDKFVNCAGNLFTYELYKELELPNPDVYLWTDYKSMYPGGIFVDWSYTRSMGRKLNTSIHEVYREKDVNFDNELCVVIDPVKKLSMVKCDKQHYRYCVVEERSIPFNEFEHVNLTLAIEGDALKLTVNYAVIHDNDLLLEQEYIMCFTDSSLYYPTKQSVNADDLFDEVFDIPIASNGYYWCTHSDTKNFYISESNKVLYIEESSDQTNLYAVKIKSLDPYPMNDHDISILLENNWIKKLKEYVYYSTEYSKSKTGSYDNVTVMNFKHEHLYLHYEDHDVLHNQKVKRLYLDAHTILLHVELYADMRPVEPGQWGSIVVEFMRPVYYCDKEKKLAPGMNYTEPECKLTKCQRKDFYDGLEMITTRQDGCSLPTDKPTTAADVTSAGVTAAATTTVDTSTTDTAQNYLEEVTTKLKKLVNSTGPFSMNDFHDVLNQINYFPFYEPWDLLASIVTKLKEFLNSTDPITVEDVGKVFTEVDNILIKKEINITGNFLRLLDGIGAKIDLNGSNVSSTVRKNIALLVADAQPNAPIKGLRVQDVGNGSFTNDSCKIINKDISSTQSNTSDMIVYLPDSVSNSKRRVSFVVFSNHQAFQEKIEYHTVNSRVVSVIVENLTKFTQGEGIYIHLKPLRHKLKRNQNRTCGFWRFNGDDSGSWSQEGCYLTQPSQTGQLDICRCDHLTHFAEILVPRTVFSKVHEDTLERLSVIGCCVSILGLLLVILTAAVFRSWRRDFSNKIWLQLCISILMLSFCFITKVYAQFEEGDKVCPLTGIVLHYSVLSSFCWMLVAAVVSYRKLVAVLSPDPTHKLLRASVFAWGVPCAIVGILLSVAPHSYAGQYEDKSPSGAFCYPSGLALWLTVYTPITLMLLSNLGLFILIVRSVFGKRRPKYHIHSYDKEAWRCASVSCLLVFLFGLPWLFGLMSSNLVCAYLFTILVTSQGFVLFVFFVCNKKTRDLWLVRLKMKQARIPVATSSTATQNNRLTGGGGG